MQKQGQRSCDIRSNLLTSKIHYRTTKYTNTPHITGSSSIVYTSTTSPVTATTSISNSYSTSTDDGVVSKITASINNKNNENLRIIYSTKHTVVLVNTSVHNDEPKSTISSLQSDGILSKPSASINNKIDNSKLKTSSNGFINSTYYAPKSTISATQSDAVLSEFSNSIKNNNNIIYTARINNTDYIALTTSNTNTTAAVIITPSLSFSRISIIATQTPTVGCDNHKKYKDGSSSGDNENRRVCQRLNSQSCMAILGNSTLSSSPSNSSSPIVSYLCSFGADSLEKHLTTIFESIHSDKTVDESCKRLTRW